MEQESKQRITRSTRSTRSSSSSGPPVRRRSLRHILQPLPSPPPPSRPLEEEEGSKVFDPSDPYSSAMDDIPLKDLFPNMKIRKRSLQNMKVETVSESPSPNSNAETDESVRFKFRDSLAIALRVVDSSVLDHDGVEMKKENQMDSKDSVKGHNQMGVEDASKRESQVDVEVLTEKAALMNGDVIMEKEKQMDGIGIRRREKQVDVRDLTETKNQVIPENLMKNDDQMPGTDVMVMPLQMQEEIKKEMLELAPEFKILQIVKEIESGHCEDECSLSREKNPESLGMEERPFKRTKMEAENIEGEDKQEPPHDLAERVAIKIECEMHRYFGGVNKKYKEKARSLLFKLKDCYNPELQARILSGEISPENLCSINAEQLASKELSHWIIAKTEESAHMVAPTDSDVGQARLAKNTHKGEFEVTIENDNVQIDEVVTDSLQQRVTLPTKQEAQEAEDPQAAEQAQADPVAHAATEIPADQEAEEAAHAAETTQEAAHAAEATQGAARAAEATQGAAPAAQAAQEAAPAAQATQEAAHAAQATQEAAHSAQATQEAAHAVLATQEAQDIGCSEDLLPALQVGIGSSLHSASVGELNLAVGMFSAKEQLVESITGALSGESEIQTALHRDAEVNLPAIMSLDEYLGTKKDRGPKSVTDADELELKLGCNEVKAGLDIYSENSPNVQKDRISRKTLGSPNRKSHESGGTKAQKEKRKEHKPNEKLWEGSFQLSGCQISPVLAIYKSGDAMDLKKWPKQIEIKGRVRLDALQKFLQEIRQSRTRAVMIITCHVSGEKSEHGASVNALKEAASQYQRGQRVGYAEPLPGYELYLFPGGGNSLKLLIDHGYLNVDQVLEDEQMLVGFVVCRRSLIPSTATHKSSSHYFNANRHALSAQLDSPTRPNEIQWAGNVIPTSKTLLLPLRRFEESENHSAPASSINLQESTSIPSNNTEGGMLGMQNKSSSNVPEKNVQKPVDLCSHSFQDPRASKRKPEWLHTDVRKDEGGSDDLPPGFGPKATRHRFEMHDVDDLPEYDFSAQKALQNKNVKPSYILPLIPPFNMQPKFATTSVVNSLLQMSKVQLETPKSFDHLNAAGLHPSHVPRPVVSHASGSMEQIRPLPLTSQASQHIVSPLTPSSSFNGFPPRLHDRSIPVKMPNISHVPNLNLMLPENKEADRPMFLEKTQINLPQSLVDSSRSDTSSLKDQWTTGNRGGVGQPSSLWDDDDMPEWCPPTRSQSETPQISPNPAIQATVESATRGGSILTPMGRGWQRVSPPVPSSTLLPSASVDGGGRSILHPPPPRYTSVLPISMSEQLLAYQSRSNEPRRGAD